MRIITPILLSLLLVYLILPKPHGTHRSYTYSKVEIMIPAVHSNHGTISWLTVESREGKGRILLDIYNTSFLDDTQDSIRRGKLTAERITGIQNHDITYSFNANSSTIDGPSAGPSITVATAFALQNKSLNKSVVITGYLEEDGSIKKVSSLLEKAQSAKNSGAKLFLVPPGEKYQVKITPNKTCEEEGDVTFCKTEPIVETINIQDLVGINVIEVSNVSEALKYFEIS